MKRVLLVLIVCVLKLGAIAQNVQTHYDMGKNRGYLTTTVEMFKPDKLGSSFFFIDMDYGIGDVEGVSSAYWEIARAFKLGSKSNYAAHIEYNGGFGQWKAGNTGGAFQFDDCWLIGFERSWNAADFSRGFTLQAMYKNIRAKHDASFQVTGVWYVNFAKKFTFSGFADFWREDNNFVNGEATTDFIFLSEPQIWYNACEHFSFGSEVELSNNFGAYKGFKVMPTIAAKWTF